jgi:cytochrome P450
MQTEDLFGPQFHAAAYAVYERLLSDPSPRWYPFRGGTGGMWLFTRYDAVAQLLQSSSISKRPPGPAMAMAREPAGFAENMLSKDPPDHGRLRSLTARVFTGKRVQALEPRIREIAETLAANVRKRGSMELMGEFATVLPAIVIADLLGVPQDDWPKFRGWSNAILTSADVSAARVAEGRDAMVKLARYFAELVQVRRADPTEDLISALVQARDQDDRLSEHELTALCMLLLIAGHETTANLIGNGLYLLLSHSEQLAAIRRDPSLLRSAVEECLRFESPVQRATFRITTEDSVIGETRISKGQQVSAVLGAANRDPAAFDDPGVFDVARTPNRHLAFGKGIHFCLGPQLARLEARASFDVLLAMYPRLRLRNLDANWDPSTSAVRRLRALRVDY